MKGNVVYLCLFLGFLQDDVLGVFRPPSNYTSCPGLLLKNGKVKRRQRGRFVKFVCNSGYLLAGERYSTCVQGKWDPLPPKCVRPTCPNKVQPPANGLIYPSHSGAALHFFCKAGYELKGPSDVYCDGWKWDSNAPNCFPINVKPKLFCDFEADDICGWTHDLNHDFDWRKENYNTPSGSIGTGPSFDHTKGPGGAGYYMYIESSSRNENDTARLISPIFDKTDTETCLEFFYHMFGATTGTLKVYLKKSSEDWTLQKSHLVFSKSGNQGDKWYRSYHSLGPIDDEYQVVIEGIRGPGYVSDIAVDDVRIIENCTYEEDTISTTTEILDSTEVLLSVESCENRCGVKVFGNESHQISCDCDDNCYVTARCCPDYLDFCGLASTAEDYYSTTEIPDEMSTVDTTRMVAKYSIPLIPTNQTPTSLPTRRTTLLKRITIPETILAITTKKPVPVPPTVHVLRPPTTPEIVRKILPTITVPNKVNNSIPNIPESNDVIDVPLPTSGDKESFATPPFSEEHVSTENIDEKVGDKLHGNYMRNLSESGKLLSQRTPNGTSYAIPSIVLSVIGVGVLVSLVVFFVVRRYRFTRRMNCSNGDSQSDVRFLTGDEVLDFSLDRNYDDL